MGLTAAEIENFNVRGARECISASNPFYACLFEFIGPNDQLSDASFPKYVYRYFDKAEHANDLLENGSLRLGSLLKYADEEAYQGARLDVAEGRAGFVTKVNGWPYQQTVISQDCWVLCTSTVLSHEIAKRFDAVACVRISMKPFALTLARAMAPHSDVGGAGIVRYSAYAGGGNVVSPDRARIPFARMHKRPKHSVEKELRIWFEPRRHRDTNREIELFGHNPSDAPTSVDPVSVTSTELTRFCRRVSVQ